jgi:hypothetical protein
VIGWPPAFNFIADFKDSFKKETWLNKFKEYNINIILIMI